MRVTQGTLLGGRVRYAQPADGFRTGIEPVLLAASVPAAPGQRVLEVGTGAGAGLLCLLARVPGVRATGVEIDPAMADLARRNLAENGFEAAVLTTDVASLSQAGASGSFDHAFANPPWHEERSTASPVARRRLAKQATAGLLERWIAAMAAVLAGSGTISVVLPAAQVERAGEALITAGLGKMAVQPFLPKAERSAKLAIVQASAGQRAVQIRPALILNAQDGQFTTEAHRLLWNLNALKL